MIRALGLIAAALFLLSGCATVKEGFGGVYYHKPLLKQILRAREGFKGLTNRICAEKNWFGECTKYDIVAYDLEQKGVRDDLVALQFRCVIGGKRYKIDPVAPQFIRYRYPTECFLGVWPCDRGELQKVSPISVTKTDYLISANAVCWSHKAYPKRPRSAK